MGDKARQYFREWREFRGFNQEQAAERIEKSRNYLSEIERGVKRYNEDVLEALAVAYSCDPWELIGRNPLLDPEPVAVLWDRISADKRESARTMLEALASKKRA